MSSNQQMNILTYQIPEMNHLCCIDIYLKVYIVKMLEDVYMSVEN